MVIDDITINKDQIVYWTRRSTEQVEGIKVHTINEQQQYFTGLELRGQRTFLFSFRCLGETVFADPVEADERLEVLKDRWRSEKHVVSKNSLSYILSGVKDAEED